MPRHLLFDASKSVGSAEINRSVGKSVNLAQSADRTKLLLLGCLKAVISTRLHKYPYILLSTGMFAIEDPDPSLYLQQNRSIFLWRAQVRRRQHPDSKAAMI